MAILLRAFTGHVDQVSRVNLENNKFYQSIKFDFDRTAERAATFEKMALFGLAGAIGLVILGASYSAGGSDSVGKVLSMAAVPVCILSYNCYQASENFRSEVIENPERLMVIAGVDEDSVVTVNRVALRRCLLNKTIFFEPFLDLYIKACMKSTPLESISPKIEEA